MFDLTNIMPLEEEEPRTRTLVFLAVLELDQGRKKDRTLLLSRIWDKGSLETMVQDQASPADPH